MVRPYAAPDLPVLTGSAAAEFDARAIRDMKVPESALMERAGTGAAALVRETAEAADALVLAGKGNNGGDAVVVARCLTAWGWRVRLLLVGDRPGGDPLLHGWSVTASRTGDLSDEELSACLGDALSRGATVVDGILGTGIRGAPRGEAARVIEALTTAAGAAAAGRVVSLDIPSGVDADLGVAPGVAVSASLTVSFGWPKLGALLHPGRALAGRHVTLEIGFPPLPPELASGHLLTPSWAAAHRPRRPSVTHKNEVGALAVVAGRPGMAGAAVLAARAALRAGAGYVRVVSHPANREIVQSALPEAVFVDASDAGAVDAALEDSRAVAVGPGMGTGADADALLDRVLAAGRPGVVDADALNLLARREDPGSALAGMSAVVTPHPGEARRLLGDDRDGEERRLEAVRSLRDSLGSVVLLKGSPSLVLGDDGLWIDTVGSSDLAVAGMGDTLTGAVGSFLAQGVESQRAAGLGLVATGRAALLSGHGAGLQSADVPEHLPRALEEGPGETPLRLPGVLLDLDPPR